MAGRTLRLGAATARAAAALVDLVLPVECAGCGAADGSLAVTLHGICAGCVRALTAILPAATSPVPVPDGLPGCIAGGPYEAARRELILEYKERGRRGLAIPLGAALAVVVAAGLVECRGDPRPECGAVHARSPARREVILVPVPATAAAVRARHGDHMLRLSRRTARVLRSWGWHPAVARPVRARPKVDSAHLDRRARVAAAGAAFTARTGRFGPLRVAACAGVPVVLLDDVVTTGSTLAALAGLLAGHGVPVAFAATLAATQLRHGGAIRGVTAPAGPSHAVWAW